MNYYYKNVSKENRYKQRKYWKCMEKDKQLIGGIFALLIGFYILNQDIQGAIIIGLAVMGLGLYWIINKL